MPIQILDEATINKIAAGEVIDRPASIVKELVENSLDAKASKISVEIKSGGIKFIRVIDNGVGISEEDLGLVPIRHATSKISKLEDIYQTKSMGFRGEAVSSICHIADLTIISKTKDADSGYLIKAEGQDISVAKKEAHNEGTSVIIQDVFQKVPVRRKYLKSPATEFSHIYTILLEYALHHPQIDFILINDGEEALNTTGIKDQKLLLMHFFGKKIKDKLINIDQKMNNIQLSGWISDPTLTYPKRSKQFYSINKRPVKNIIIQKIISDIYRDLIPSNRFPLVVLDLDISEDIIDINIHPKKLEVKFLSPDLLFRTLPVILKNQFAKTPVVLNTNNYQKPNYVFPEVVHNKGESQISYFNNETSSDNSKITNFPLFKKDAITSFDEENLEYLQIFDTYIVLKTGDALWIFDQHAVHERILYERLKEVEKNKQKIEQPLLISEVIALSPAEQAGFSKIKEMLIKIGFDIEDFGGSQIIVRKVPIELANCNIREWFLLLLEELQADLKNFPSMPDQKDFLQMKACKAAVKAGRKLDINEIKSLVKDLISSKNSYTCPHGRPLYIKYNKENLEKMFLRR